MTARLGIAAFFTVALTTPALAQEVYELTTGEAFVVRTPAPITDLHSSLGSDAATVTPLTDRRFLVSGKVPGRLDVWAMKDSNIVARYRFLVFPQHEFLATHVQ